MNSVKIMHPKECHIPILKNMWHEIFNDHSTYIDYLFNEKFTKENTLIALLDEKIASVIYFLDFDLKVEQQIVKTSYLCGVSTRKEYRNLGLVRKLIDEYLKLIESRGIKISVLIPTTKDLFPLYEKFGYFNAFYLDKIEFSLEEYGYYPLTQALTNENLMKKYYPELTDKIPHFPIRNEQDFDFIARELLMYNGTILSFQGEINGYAVVFKNIDKLIVKEYYFEKEQDLVKFLGYAQKRFQVQKALLFSYHKNKTITPFAMAKTNDTNLEKLLKNNSGYINFMLN